MTSTNPYLDVQKSLLAFCKRFSEENPIFDFLIEDFDSHATIEEYEKRNYIGIMEYEFEDSGGTIEVDSMIGVMMLHDDKIQNLRELMGKMAMKLCPGSSVPVLNGTTGTPVGNLKVGAMRVLPISREAKNRPVQFIGVHFLSDLSTQARP